MADIIYGLTDQGLVVKTRPVIRADINAALQNQFDNKLNLTDGSVIGQIVAIISDRLGELWELTEQVNNSSDPDKATGDSLDAICVLTGTFRPHATRSTVELILTGDPTTFVPANSTFATRSTNQNFESVDDATLTVVAAWAASTSYITGARVTNGSSPARVYQCITAGTSSATLGAGPTGTTPDATPDGSAFWTYLGDGTAVAAVDGQSVETGVIIAVSKDITQIINAITGLRNATNVDAADPGRDDATDVETRQRREDELANAGSTPFDALRAHLLEVTGVSAVALFVNNTDLMDADGVPPHSIEALVTGGADQDIFDALRLNLAVGIGTTGNTSGTSTNSQGTPIPYKFSRPVLVPIYIRMNVIVDSLSYPADGDVQVANAVLAYGAVKPLGSNVYAAQVGAQAFKVTGVLNVPTTSVQVSTQPIPVATAWVATTSYTAGSSAVTNDGGRAYVCTTSGVSGSTGPTGTGSSITDGSAVWSFLSNVVIITSRQQAQIPNDGAHVIVTHTAGDF